MKKVTIIYIAAVILVAASVSLYVRGDLGFGIKHCPEAWYDNQMPGIDPSSNNQYLIVNGERRELADFNMKWIQSHCSVSGPSVVS